MLGFENYNRESTLEDETTFRKVPSMENFP